MSDSLPPHGLISPWNSLGQNTRVSSLPFSRGSSQPRNGSKTSILWCSTFFIVSHPYTTDYWKHHSFDCAFIGKVMSLFLNTLSRFVIAFLPRSKHLLISWLQSPSTVILEPKKIKSVTLTTVSPSICHEVMGLDAMIFMF